MPGNKGSEKDVIQWTPIDNAEIFAAFGVKFDKLEDGSFIAKGDNATANNYIVKARTSLTGITGFQIDLLSDKNLPRGGPGRAADGTCTSRNSSLKPPVAAPESLTAPVCHCHIGISPVPNFRFQSHRQEYENALEQ